VNANDGATFNARAFLWTRGRGIRSLGTLPGDALSQALGINDQRQVVGISCTAGFAGCRAFLWQNGVMTDLNELVAGEFDEHLFTANDINERGEITGQSLAATGARQRQSFAAGDVAGECAAAALAATGTERSQLRPLGDCRTHR